MRLSQRLIAACAVALVPAAPALAADYDPPIYIEQAPEFVPVEVGSGWYLRGDISYNFKERYDFTLLGVDTDHNRIGAGVGFGYHFTDNLRGDLTISYDGGDEFAYDDGIDAANLSHTVWSGLINGYLDIATVMGFTPYVGAGVGLTYSKHSIDIAAPSVPVAASFSDRQYNFAYALMAGAAYKVTDNASVDLGYRFLHTPDMEYLDTDTGTVEEGMKQHQIRVGLRYDLW